MKKKIIPSWLSFLGLLIAGSVVKAQIWTLFNEGALDDSVTDFATENPSLVTVLRRLPTGITKRMLVFSALITGRMVLTRPRCMLTLIM